MTKTKGLTLMTVEKHKFDGFNIRKQCNGYCFRKYVSASKRKYPDTSITRRQNRARIHAIADLAILTEILKDPKSWWRGRLRSSRLEEILNLGFTHA